MIVGLQPTAWPAGPGVIEKTEPAVGLEPTWAALQERCPACRASPAFPSSQCWCRANSTEVQSLRPLPRAWLTIKRVDSRLRSEHRDGHRVACRATTPYPPSEPIFDFLSSILKDAVRFESVDLQLVVAKNRGQGQDDVVLDSLPQGDLAVLGIFRDTET